MIHFIPYPTPRTPKMIREDNVKQNKQSELVGAYASFLVGMIACFIAILLLI